MICITEKMTYKKSNNILLYYYYNKIAVLSSIKCKTRLFFFFVAGQISALFNVLQSSPMMEGEERRTERKKMETDDG